MATLSFPKNPVRQSEAAPRAKHPANAVRGTSRWEAGPKGGFLLTLLQAGLLLSAPTAFAQAPGAANPAANGAAPAAPPATPPSSAGAASAGTLWTRPVAPVSWTVTFKYGSVVAPEQAAHRPTLVKVTVLGKEALETIQYPDRTAEVWRTEGAVILSEAGSEDAGFRLSQSAETFGTIGGANEGLAGVSHDKKGNFLGVVSGVLITGNVAQEAPDWVEFGEFDWVTAAMLKGKIEIGGEKLLVYSDWEPEAPAPAAGKGRATAPHAPKFPPGPLGGLPLKPGIRVAAIEETHKTPRYLQIGENIQIYTFSKPQQTKLEVPPKIANMVAKPATPPVGATPVSLVP